MNSNTVPAADDIISISGVSSIAEITSRLQATLYLPIVWAFIIEKACRRRSGCKRHRAYQQCESLSPTSSPLLQKLHAKTVSTKDNTIPTSDVSHYLIRRDRCGYKRHSTYLQCEPLSPRPVTIPIRSENLWHRNRLSRPSWLQTALYLSAVWIFIIHDFFYI